MTDQQMDIRALIEQMELEAGFVAKWAHERRSGLRVRPAAEDLQACAEGILAYVVKLRGLLADVPPPPPSGWQPITTAPKGGGAEITTDPAWVEPPKILVLLSDGNPAIVYWDWYYAAGGNGCTDGVAWVDSSGETLSSNGLTAVLWSPMSALPAPPRDQEPT